MTKSFYEWTENHFETLDLYTAAITRAHGKNHPEAFSVRDLFVRIQSKVQKVAGNVPDLTTEFAELQEITNHYAIPGDVCETYAATYHLLEELEQIYRSV